MSIRITNIFFDLDGTLIDSAPSILAGFAAVLDASGLTAQRPLDSSVIGPPLMDTLAQLTGVADPVALASLATQFKQYYDSEGFRLSVAYPGVDEVLASLFADGIDLHLTTNKRTVPTQMIVTHFGWDEWLRSTYALDMPGQQFGNKAAMLAQQLLDQGVDPAGAIYVGDHDGDRAAASANGVMFVAAKWGYGHFPATMPDPAMDSMQEVLAWVRRHNAKQ